MRTSCLQASLVPLESNQYADRRCDAAIAVHPEPAMVNLKAAKSQAASRQTAPAAGDPEPEDRSPVPKNPLLDDPILPRLLKMATPNTLALGAGMAVVIFGGWWLISMGVGYIWFFVLAATAMAAFGLFTAATIHWTPLSAALKPAR